MRRFEGVFGKEIKLTKIPVVTGIGGDPRVMYLQVLDHAIRDHADLFRVKPTEKFFDWLEKEVTAYVESGKVSSPAIAGAVMNLADDLGAGRDITLRAGDYLTLMQQAKAQKIV